MDPFALLGLPRRYALDSAALESRYRELQKALHPDRHASATASVRRLSLSKAVEVNQAYRTLKDDLRRADALLAALGYASTDAGPPEDPEWLMEIMDLREQLSEAKHGRDLATVRRLADRALEQQAEGKRALEQAFDAHQQGESLAPIAAIVGRLKYWRRFLDEVAVIEEEAMA